MRNLQKRTILLIVLILGVTTAFAAVTLIGGGSATSYDGWGSYYGYMRSAQIYTATEIGGYGMISSVGFLPNLTKATANIPVVVYMRTTTATAEVAETWATKTTGLTAVYTGTIASLTLQTWANVTLPADFNYNANNLEVLVECNYGGSGNSPYPQYYASVTTGTNSAWYIRADTIPTGTGTATSTRPNIRLNFTSFTASLATPTQAEFTAPMHQATGLGYRPTFTWNAGNGNAPTGYRIYLGTDGSGTTLPTTYANGVDIGLVYTYTPGSNLAASTAYWWAAVPYDGSGTAPYTPIWKFTIASVLTGVVTGFLPATGASNVSNIGILQWSVLSGATSYDVYFGITMPGTPNANVVPNAGASYVYWDPGELSYSQAYTWKVVGRNALGPSTGIPSTPTFTTWADQTVNLGSASVNQNFDAAATMPVGWTTYKTDITTASTGIWAPSTSYYVSGTRSAYFGSGGFSTGTQGVLISPRLTLPADACRVKFQYRHYNGYPTYLNEKTEVYINSSPTLSGATLLTTAVCYNATTGWEQITQALPVGAGSGRYIFFKGLSLYGSSQYIDDIIIEKIPQTPDAASTPYPAITATLVGPSPTFTWHRGPLGAAPTGYWFNLGTSAAANELVSNYNNGADSTYTYGSPLTAGTPYYWKIVPKNAVGDCSTPATWSFTTASLVTGVATTPYPADAANPVMNNATLTWSSVTNATAYDVYFGTTMPGTANATVTTPLSWTPPTMTYGQAYTWKIVPKNDFGVTGGTPSVWTFTVGPNPLVTTFPLVESFDVNRAYSGPYGWTNQSISALDPQIPVIATPSTVAWDYQTTSSTNPACTPHSGVGMTRYNAYSITGGNHAVMSTPPMNVPGDDYRVTFWMYRDLSGSYNTVKFSDEGVAVWYGTSPTDTTSATKLTFVPRDGVFAPTATTGWHQYVVPFGTSSGGNGKYVMLKVKSQFGNNIYVDDVRVEKIPTAPLPAYVTHPTNGATSIALTDSLSWIKDSSGPDPTGYLIYLGTNNPPTNMVDSVDVGLVNKYMPAGLALNGHYYWKVVPYNLVGHATGCPVWSFYTVGVPGVVTVHTPADSAANVGRNASVTWGAVATATSYDVYFGQTLPGTANANVTTPLTWTPPTMTANTMYLWKVVAKNTYGDAVGSSTWRFTTGTGWVYSESYATSIYDDDIGQFLMADVTNPAVHPDSIPNAASENTYTDYTAITIHVQQGHSYPTQIHQISEDNFYPCWGKVFIDFNQNGTFDLPDEQVLSGQTSSTHMQVNGFISIPWDVLLGDTRLRVVLKESGTELNTLPVGTYSWGETEDYTINVVEAPPPPPPPSAFVDSPLDLATNVSLMPTCAWHPNLIYGPPSGYKISLGTNNPPTNLLFEQNLGNVTTYTPEIGDLAYSTHYYWQIIPYNPGGNADSCSVWQFTTMDDPTITDFPYFEGFEDSIFPPAGWVADQWSRTTGSHEGTYGARATYTPAGTKTLTTPQINGDLNYMSWWWKNNDMATGKIVAHDTTYVEITTDGGTTWTVLTSLSAASVETAYHQEFVGLESYSGIIQIRWRYVTDASYSAFGVGLDDIQINGVPQPAKFQMILPVTPLGGSSSGFFNIQDIPDLAYTTGTITYSEGLSGPATFTTLGANGSIDIEITYTPIEQGLFTGLVSVTSNGGDFTIEVVSNAGINAVTWEAVPAGWSVYNLDTDDFTWDIYTGEAHSGTNSAGVYWNSAGCNDWLISPRYDIQDGDILSFYAKCMDADYPEAMQVIMSTTGQTPVDFTATPLLNLTIDSVLYTGYSVDLSPYTGQTASFAFHCSSVDAYFLSLDDVGLPGLAPPIIPSVPDSIFLTVVPTGVQLDWNPASDATGYNVYKSADPYASDSLWTYVTTVSTNSYLDTSSIFKNFYKIIAVNNTKSGRNNAHALKAQNPLQIKHDISARKQH